jgi:transcriptional regulator with XRE-family HTH domain
MVIPNPTDRYAGQRLQKRRRALGLSQKMLAARVQLTWQQIRKYEAGTNRIGAGRLYDFATILRVPIRYFFEDAENTSGAPDRDAADLQHELFAFVASKEGHELLAAFQRIPGASMRRRIVKLVRALTDEPQQS